MPRLRAPAALLLGGLLLAIPALWGCRGSQGAGNPFLSADRVPPPAPKSILPGSAVPYYQGDPLPPMAAPPQTAWPPGQTPVNSSVYGGGGVGGLQQPPSYPSASQPAGYPPLPGAVPQVAPAAGSWPPAQPPAWPGSQPGGAPLSQPRANSQPTPTGGVVSDVLLTAAAEPVAATPDRPTQPPARQQTTPASLLEWGGGAPTQVTPAPRIRLPGGG